MSRYHELPEPTNREHREEVITALERWKKRLYPDLPGEPVTPEEFSQLTSKLVAWRDCYAPQIDIMPMVRLHEMLLQCGRIEAGLALPWNPTPTEIQATAQEAVNCCERLKTSLRRPDKESRQSKKTRRGRKQTYDPKEDERVHDAWQSGEHDGYDGLAHDLGCGWTVEKVRRALDRHRKRQAKAPRSSFRR